MSAQILPPVPYFGGKQRIAQQIVAHFPTHDHYVEPFAGGLSVLLAKPQSKAETVNDLNGDLMTFWRVLRDQPDEFERVCALTPHSRSELIAAGHRGSVSDIEAARRVWVLLTQGRSARLKSPGWRNDPAAAAGLTPPQYLRGYVKRIAPAAARLSQVSLECKPAAEIIDSYGDHANVLLYVDPPYLGETRTNSTQEYAHELTSATDHAELLRQLSQCRAAVVLSGYRSDLYDSLLTEGWTAVDIIASTTQGGAETRDRTETLWCNREAARDVPGLFEVTA